MMATNSIKLLTGNSHPELAKLVADRYVWHAHKNSLPSSRPKGGTAGKRPTARAPAALCQRKELIMSTSLGIELTKIMVLQYSNQETSVTIGESVRDEDGTPSIIPIDIPATCGLTRAC